MSTPFHDDDGPEWPEPEDWRRTGGVSTSSGPFHRGTLATLAALGAVALIAIAGFAIGLGRTGSRRAAFDPGGGDIHIVNGRSAPRRDAVPAVPIPPISGEEPGSAAIGVPTEDNPPAPLQIDPAASGPDEPRAPAASRSEPDYPPDPPTDPRSEPPPREPRRRRRFRHRPAIAGAFRARTRYA
jgi:hypothetical protein